MASIEQLDNPLLLLIFNNLSIEELFPAGRVCVRWNAVRVTSARARQELVLLIGKDAQSYIDGSGFQIPKREILVDGNGDVIFPKNDQSNVQLQIHSFPLDFASLLYAHFDQLTTLTISIRLYTNDIDSITQLLKQFNRRNRTLHTLKLYSGHDPNGQYMDLNLNHFSSYVDLLSTVNQIQSLRVLTFDVNTKFASNSKFPRITLKILETLEEFEFNMADDLECIQHSIRNYAVDNRRLRRIGFQFPIHDFVWLLSLTPELSSRFKHLHLQLNSSNISGFTNFCRYFTCLTSLEITYKLDVFTILKLFRPLSQLPNLLSLVVNIAGTALKPVGLNSRGIIRYELPSVKVFTMNIGGMAPSHNFFHACNINRVFPNVQVVRVIHEESLCLKCDNKMDRCTTKDPLLKMALEEHCVRYMFRYFTHSQQLRMVSFKVGDKNNVSSGRPRYREWAWNEMEPYEEEDIALARICRLSGKDEEELEWSEEEEEMYLFENLVEFEDDDFRDRGLNY